MEILEGKSEQQLKKAAAKSKGCGQCALACPTKRAGLFNPTGVLSALQAGNVEKAITAWDIYNCLCCNHCMIDCPSAESSHYNNDVGMNFAELIKDLRQYAIEHEINTVKSDSFADTFYHLHEDPKKIRNKNYFKEFEKDSSLKIQEQGEVAFFFGCPKGKDGRNYNDVISAVIKVLNKVGLSPVLISSSGSGHDDYWAGYMPSFIKIAQKNVDAFRDAGVNRIIVEDAETYHILKYTYPKYIENFTSEFEVVHLSEYLLEGKRYKKFRFRPNLNTTVAIHQTSRLGWMGDDVYTSILKVTKLIPSLSVIPSDSKQDIGTGIMMENGSKSEKLWENQIAEIAESGAHYFLTPSLKALYILEAKMDKPLVKEWGLFLSRCIV